jgi:hypothetical protein
MRTNRTWQRAGKTVAMMLAGSLMATGCTVGDINNNLMAGTLAFVKSGATTFWSALFPVDEWTAGLWGNP